MGEDSRQIYYTGVGQSRRRREICKPRHWPRDFLQRDEVGLKNSVDHDQTTTQGFPQFWQSILSYNYEFTAYKILIIIQNKKEVSSHGFVRLKNFSSVLKCCNWIRTITLCKKITLFGTYGPA